MCQIISLRGRATNHEWCPGQIAVKRFAAIAEGIEAYGRREVVPRHQRHAELLGNPREKYSEDGRYSPAVVALIREVRMASSAASYFTMITPTSKGGNAISYLAYYAAC